MSYDNTISGVEVKFKNRLFPVIVSASSVADLKENTITEHGVSIGASVTLTTMGDFLKDVIVNEPGIQLC